ncbi:peptide deformylase [Rhizobium sp. Root274]|uniref:peptide deformylase n=1 Tax=unclassified Rhizobium TaxID=2613769 RepID=UPI000715C0CF|nr:MULTISPECIES: peptide deformylase [unclassified Rhizobium]KQW28586.1 peptide deformylase [Rhizobium sp. Root1240]KRD28787.1 peptide deformylase [Rhizobium sp. Root274]
MTLLPICRYPDPALKTPCTPVADFDAALVRLLDDLDQTMKAAPGVGITAAHCGIFKRVVVLDLPEIGGRRDFVNPEVIETSAETMTHVEGSVSMPGFTEEVTRPRRITLRYQTADGTVMTEDFEGFPAICLQHEVDQLDGLFWIQRLSRLKRERILKKWEKANR